MFHVKQLMLSVDISGVTIHYKGDDYMQMIFDILEDYQFIILLALIILIVILIFMETLNRIELNRIEKRYKKLMKGSYGKNIEEMIAEHTSVVENSLESIKEIKDAYDSVENKLKNCVQKYSVVRYRAFDDVGSDLSFSIALLDENNDGMIITGIYGRNESTTFAKPIENGISKYDLSEEEKLAIKKAMQRI